MPNKTQFDRLTDKAVSAVRELRRLESMRKLSAGRFMDEALANAECDHAALDELDAKLAASQEATAVLRFRHRMARVIVEPGFTRSPPKPIKMALAYGTDGVEAQTLGLGSTIAAVIALAVRDATRAHPECFGPIMTTWDAHQALIVKARTAADHLLQRMREEYGPKDVAVDSASLTPSQRSEGLARIVFKRCPSVSPGNPNWPRDLVNALMEPPAAEPAAPKSHVPAVDLEAVIGGASEAEAA
jgi:hypothetical protein